MALLDSVASGLSSGFNSLVSLGSSYADYLSGDLLDLDQSGGGLYAQGLGESLGLQAPGTPHTTALSFFNGGNNGSAPTAPGTYQTGSNSFTVVKPNGKRVDYVIVKASTLARRSKRSKRRGRGRGGSQIAKRLDRIESALLQGGR